MKPGTFTQLNVQIVFAVKYRECLLNHSRREELFPYISGVITNFGHKSLAVNGYSGYIHIFLGLNPSKSISDTVSVIKKSSCGFINEKKWFPGKFQWQDGYAAFSYSKSQVESVYMYIMNQENHHKSKSFKEEYKNALNEAGIKHNEKFLFDFFDDQGN